MATHYQNLMNSTLGDGARATKFDVQMFFSSPNILTDFEVSRFLAKATSMPGKTHDVIDFKYKGRSIPIKGQVKYNQTWDITYYLTEDHRFKSEIELWMESLDQKHNYHYRLADVNGLADAQRYNNDNRYTGSGKVVQKNFNNDQDTAVYTLYNMYPVATSAVEYSADAVGQVQEFTVTFAYSHYVMEVIKGDAGNFIDGLIDGTIDIATGFVDSALQDISNLASDALGSVAGSLLNNLNYDTGYKTATEISEQLSGSFSKMKSSIFDAGGY
jgi:hypothetical protein